MSQLLRIGFAVGLLIVVPAAEGAVQPYAGARAHAVAKGVTACPRTGVEKPGDRIDAAGILYRYYGGYGYRFQPLASFARLNGLVTARSPVCVRRLASALRGRAVRRGGALYWEYDFPYGGPVRWSSGFAQAVAAEALVRAGGFLLDDGLVTDARSAFAALRRTLLMPLGGGLWVREYSFTDAAILNAQLESVLSIERYARVGGTLEASRVAGRMRSAARRLLPQFDLGCWARYALGGAPATPHYQRYHVDLLRRLARAHPEEPIWRETYADWSRCLR